jgi:hypothetical protein
MLTKLLALAFVLLLVGRLLFRPQLRALGKWLDGLVNAMLIAIVVVYAAQLVILLARG